MLDRNYFVYVIFPGISVFLTVLLEAAGRRQVFHHFVQGVCGVSKPVSLQVFISPFQTPLQPHPSGHMLEPPLVSKTY